MSHLERGAWIEIRCGLTGTNFICGRTSKEVRGLKLERIGMDYMSLSSHLERGAWIEIRRATNHRTGSRCRTSKEVRGLKLVHSSLKEIR